MRDATANGRAIAAVAAVLGVALPGLASAQFAQEETFFDLSLPFEGPYLGFQGAMTSPGVAMEVREASFDVGDAGFEDEDASLSFGTDALGARGELFVGAGLQNDLGIHYGVEANYTLGHAIDDDALEAVDGLTAEISDGYGLSVRIGGVLEEGTSMFYGRLSYQVRDLEIQADGDGSDSDSSTFNGVGVGFGLEYRSTQLPVMMRVEGNWYRYGDEDLFDEDLEVEFTEAALNFGVGYAW